VLTSYPGVAQAAVFGVPDAVYGEKVSAIVVARRGLHLDPTDLTSYCQTRLAAFEIPERITFADKLALTAKRPINRAKLAASTRQ
jgi:oxalate---CoA ligase